MQEKSSIVIRDMEPGEAPALLGAARRAFAHSPMEQLAISKPQTALVAEVDGAVAGAMFLRTYGAGEKKIGYLDVGFVAREYRGLGVGRVLYPAATGRLRQMGCKPIAAMVIDDNVASWKSLENQGLGTPTLTGLVRLLGLGPALSLWLKTMLCLACGAQFWVDAPVKKRGSVSELFSFLWVNLLLFLPGLLLSAAAQPARLGQGLLALLVVLLTGFFFGGLGGLAGGGTWRFAFPRGGLGLSLLLNTLGVVFPMVGRWYPRDPQATGACRRAMGIQAAVEWAGVLLLFCLGAFVLPDNAFLHRCATLAANLLVYRLIPFMPFGSFGSGRVWAWSKPAFAVLALATLAPIVLVVFVL